MPTVKLQSTTQYRAQWDPKGMGCSTCCQPCRNVLTRVGVFSLQDRLWVQGRKAKETNKKINLLFCNFIRGRPAVQSPRWDDLKVAL